MASLVERPRVMSRLIAVAAAVCWALLAGTVAFVWFLMTCVLGEPGDPPPHRPGSLEAQACHWRDTDDGVFVLGAIFAAVALIVVIVMLALRDRSLRTTIALVLAPGLLLLAVPLAVNLLPG